MFSRQSQNPLAGVGLGALLFFMRYSFHPHSCRWLPCAQVTPHVRLTSTCCPSTYPLPISLSHLHGSAGPCQVPAPLVEPLFRGQDSAQLNLLIVHVTSAPKSSVTSLYSQGQVQHLRRTFGFFWDLGPSIHLSSHQTIS